MEIEEEQVEMTNLEVSRMLTALEAEKVVSGKGDIENTCALMEQTSKIEEREARIALEREKFEQEKKNSKFNNVLNVIKTTSSVLLGVATLGLTAKMADTETTEYIKCPKALSEGLSALKNVFKK